MFHHLKQLRICLTLLESRQDNVLICQTFLLKVHYFFFSLAHVLLDITEVGGAYVRYCSQPLGSN